MVSSDAPEQENLFQWLSAFHHSAVAALDMKGQTLGHGTPFLCGEAEMSSSLGIL
jgi:hypothetical protein